MKSILEFLNNSVFEAKHIKININDVKYKTYSTGMKDAEWTGVLNISDIFSKQMQKVLKDTGAIGDEFKLTITCSGIGGTPDQEETDYLAEFNGIDYDTYMNELEEDVFDELFSSQTIQDIVRQITK